MSDLASLQRRIEVRHEVYRVMDERLSVNFYLRRPDEFSFQPVVSFTHEIPLGATVVVRSGKVLHFESVEVSYPEVVMDWQPDSSPMAVTELFDLADQCAAILPEPAWKIAGVQGNNQPVSRFLAWVMVTMQNDPVFVTEPGTEAERRYDHRIVLRKPFLAMKLTMSTIDLQPTVSGDSPKQGRDKDWLGSALTARSRPNCYPPTRAKRWSEDEVDADTEAAMHRVFENLYELTPDTDGDPVVLRLSPDAKDLRVDFVNEHGHEQAGLSGALSSAWSKLEAYAFRFALVIHETRVAERDPSIVDPYIVDAQSISSGVALARWFGYETRRIYAVLSGDERSMQGHKLAEFIRRRGGMVTLRDLQRAVYSGQQSAAIRAQLRPHLDSGWLEAVQMPAGVGGGRPSECYRLADTMTTDKTPAGDQSQGVLSVSHGGAGGE